ncbi:hypothetical protein OH77DRAFT_1322030 [Trametes cingulata]|nr:hypothetical protein OH77DRAFT_1322030 [Trametes cingulata]
MRISFMPVMDGALTRGLQLRKKNAGAAISDSSSTQSVTDTIPGGWTDSSTAASGVSIVVTSETDAGDDPKAEPVPVPSECRFSVKSSDVAHIYVSPARPQNSTLSEDSMAESTAESIAESTTESTAESTTQSTAESTAESTVESTAASTGETTVASSGGSIVGTPEESLKGCSKESAEKDTEESDWPSSPKLDEAVAYELLNIFYYWRPSKAGSSGGTADSLKDLEDKAKAKAQGKMRQPAKAKVKAKAKTQTHPQAQERAQTQPEPQTQTKAPAKPQDGVFANLTHILLFFPWCIAVGGAILLAPSSAGRIAFHGGFLRDAPPPGLRRFAYWAANAYEHVFVFLAACAFFYLHNPTAQRLTIIGACALRFVWVWHGYTPPAPQGVVQRLGEDDQESLWLAWQGKMLIGTLMRERERRQQNRWDGMDDEVVGRQGRGRPLRPSRA